MKKIISFLLAAVLLVSAVPTVSATNDYTAGTAVVYTATNTEAYTVTVPAQLAPGGSGTVTLEGTWASDRVVSVTADKNVVLTNSIKAADKKTLNVSFPGIDEYGSNTTSQTFTETVSVAGISDALFGTWSGRFYYNVDVYGVVDYLQAKYPFDYYSTMNLAVTDVNNGTIGASADSDKGDAVAGIYTDENGGVNVVLLKDHTITEKINPSIDMTINLGGHTLFAENSVAIEPTDGNIVIDGRLSGSTISVSRVGKSPTVLQLRNASNVTVNGGTYISNSVDSAAVCMATYETSHLNITDADIQINGNTTVYAIQISKTNSLAIANCSIKATSTSKTVTAIRSVGTTTVSNCDITAIHNGDGDCYGINNTEGTITVSNCDITAIHNGDGGCYGIANPSGATSLTASDCDITATHNGNGMCNGINNTGATATVSNCDIKAYSNYLSGFSTASQGVITYGALTMNDCYVFGTHSGVSCSSTGTLHGTLYVNGGTYEGYGHGGFYLANTDGSCYIRNATIRECSLPNGYIATASNNGSGFYIGGGAGKDNISVYMDNCDIYGSTQPIVLRGTDGEQNNSLYISNSTISGAMNIRIDNNTHRLYIGTGNNFTAGNTTLPEAVVVTDETYIYNG